MIQYLQCSSVAGNDNLTETNACLATFLSSSICPLLCCECWITLRHHTAYALSPTRLAHVGGNDREVQDRKQIWDGGDVEGSRISSGRSAAVHYVRTVRLAKMLL